MPKSRKQSFLREQYRRMLASNQPIHPIWRESFDAFAADLDHMTPNSAVGRIIACRSPKLGFVPGNIEWHWEKKKAPEPIRQRAQ